jgi:hypothetical protein
VVKLDSDAGVVSVSIRQTTMDRSVISDLEHLWVLQVTEWYKGVIYLEGPKKNSII